ncbi:MAG TPA: quinone-dependent dihydroorotate dehydrogenase [Anaerolineales bacterium]|nr:quinone-dependent dihydroorotate dehydrogenase [Anaerolineales bacterium]
MYPFFRTYLFKLYPETAHQLTLNAVRLAGWFPPSRWIMQASYRAPAKPVHAFGLDFKNPIGLAAGFDKDGLAVRGLATLGFGHIEVGTVTPLPQKGNPKPRMFRLIEDQAVINRLGFPSRGTEFVQERLNSSLRPNWLERFLGFGPRKPKRTKKPVPGIILGINIGKNKSTPNEEAVFDYLALLQNFAPIADYLTINVSSPNTEGLRRLQARDTLEELLRNLHQQRVIEEKQLQRSVPMLVKLAPDLSEQELDDAVDVILRTRMDGIIVTNTTVQRVGLQSSDRGEEGGLSGKPLRALSEAMLQNVVTRVKDQIPVVSVGGIMNPDDAKRRLDMGAALIQIYTGMVYYGPGLVKAIARFL